MVGVGEKKENMSVGYHQFPSHYDIDAKTNKCYIVKFNFCVSYHEEKNNKRYS